MWIIRANRPGQSLNDVMKTSGPLSRQLCIIYQSRWYWLAKLVYTWYGFRGGYRMLMLDCEEGE